MPPIRGYIFDADGTLFDVHAVTEAAREITGDPAALSALGLRADEILFVSSNAWDIAGAKAFGYRVTWCNRVGAPAEELGVQPDDVIATLDAVPT